MNSYQKRKVEISYLEQRISELELKVAFFENITEERYISPGLKGDEFLTPENCPEL